MAYQKTAKDKAWDRERQKLKGEVTFLENECASLKYDIAKRDITIDSLSHRIQELEAAIQELTNSEMTPDEIIAKMSKNAELADMMKFLANGTRGIF